MRSEAEENQGDQNLFRDVTDLYKDLSEPREVTTIKIIEIECKQINAHVKQFLTSEIILEEIKHVLFDMKYYESASVDGLLTKIGSRIPRGKQKGFGGIF